MDHGALINRFDAIAKGQFNRDHMREAMDQADQGAPGEDEKWKTNLQKQGEQIGDDENDD